MRYIFHISYMLLDLFRLQTSGYPGLGLPLGRANGLWGGSELGRLASGGSVSSAQPGKKDGPPEGSIRGPAHLQSESLRSSKYLKMSKHVTSERRFKV